MIQSILIKTTNYPLAVLPPCTTSSLTHLHSVHNFSQKMELERFLLYAHGPDLCRSSDLKHALANCLEALMGALYLEGGISVVRRIFCNLLFDTEKLRRIWMEHPKHPLQVSRELRMTHQLWTTQFHFLLKFYEYVYFL